MNLTHEKYINKLTDFMPTEEAESLAKDLFISASLLVDCWKNNTLPLSALPASAELYSKDVTS